MGDRGAGKGEVWIGDLGGVINLTKVARRPEWCNNWDGFQSKWFFRILGLQ